MISSVIEENSLFQSILDDFANSELSEPGRAALNEDAPHVRTGLRGEISFLEKRKDILAVMLMESFRSQDPDTSLFQCIEVAMPQAAKEGSSLRLVHEFFTGFVPLLAFVVLKDRWCDYFGYDKREVLGTFVESFVASHVETHPQRQRVDAR